MIEEEVPPEDLALFAALRELPEVTVPAHLAESLHQRAGAAKPPGIRRTWLALAAGLMLVAGLGWWREHALRLAEQARGREELLAALGSFSPSERLQAIATSVRHQGGGGEVERALITALLTDPQASVRIAAAEALAQIASPGRLSPVLQQALTDEDSPFVQLALLHATERLTVTGRQGAVQALLAREQIDPLVRRDAVARLSHTNEEVGE